MTTFAHPGILTRLNIHPICRAAQALGRQPPGSRYSCRTAFICPAAFNSSPAGASIRCATITILCQLLLGPLPPARAHPRSRTRRSGCLSICAITYPAKSSLTLYGNYGVLLSLGPQGRGGSTTQSVSCPFFTRQAEIGAKYEPGQRILLTTAFFACARRSSIQGIQAPIAFARRSEFNGPAIVFESEGRETHDGVEVNAEGKAANWLRLTASAAAIRAISDDTGTPAFDNKQVINVPHLRTALFADLRCRMRADCT
jgi:hypothetical protein